MLAKVAGFFSNQASQRLAPFELTPGQWQVRGRSPTLFFVKMSARFSCMIPCTQASRMHAKQCRQKLLF